MKSIRANQETGLVDPALLIQANKAAQTSAKDVELSWYQAGPDNYGGFTRAIVYDKDGNIVIGTMGGDIFKSTNGGITFQRITFLNIPISCMAMNAAGDIFVGTGDGRDAQRLNGLSDFNYETSFIGNGIYKMAHGTTALEQLASTAPATNAGWEFVNEIAIAGNKIYAATDGGLMVSTNGGNSWELVLQGTFRSVKANNSGAVLASDTESVVYAADGTNFAPITGTDELPTPVCESIIAMSPTDANYMYIAYLTYIASSATYGTGDIYFTNDGGETWNPALSANALYPIFGKYANYNGFMTVYPNNPKKLLIGADDIWVFEDELGAGTNSYRPLQVSENNCYEYAPVNALNPTRYKYVHQGIQNIVFNAENPNEFFIGTVGGVFKGIYTSQIYSFNGCNRYFIDSENHTSVARMMTVGIGGGQQVLGGSLDHGTLRILGSDSINNVMTGRGIFPNPDLNSNANQELGFFTSKFSAGQCAISTVNPNIMFVSGTGEMDNTPLYRTETAGEDYDSENFLGGVDAVVTNANAFRTPYALFENYNDANNPHDTIYAPIRQTKHVGETVYAYSIQAGYPVDHVITEEPPHDAAHHINGEYVWIAGDTIRDIHDPISSLYVCGTEGKIYMTRDALIFNKLTDWILVSNITGLPTAVTISGDGDVAMVGTAAGVLYTVSGLANAYTAAQACVDSAACVTTLTSYEDFNGQAITSIAIDPTNSNNVIVTLGNYGNDNYVYKSTNGGSSFSSIQGNLGKYPVYSSVIEKSSKLIIIGTDKGIYTTSWNSTSWAKSGNISCPVMDIKQAVQANHEDKIDVLYDETGTATYITYPGVHNEGMIYAATYGSGVIACATFYDGGDDFGVDENTMATGNVQLNVYPNPVKGNAQMNISLNETAKVSYTIYDLSGRLITSRDLGVYAQGEHSVMFSTENLASGSYIIRLQAGDAINSAKILVY